jgi:hypothetical protein
MGNDSSATIAQLLGELNAARRLDLRGYLEEPLVAYAVGSVPGVDPTGVKRLVELNQRVVQSRGCRCAVIATPPS